MFSNVEPLTKPVTNAAALSPCILEPDPFASYGEVDVFECPDNIHIKGIEIDIMNVDDEPLSGLNGRLRPRKSAASSPHAAKPTRKPDRPKRTSTPSKVAAPKPDDLANKSDLPTAPQLLCPYCDRKFASKQNVSKHARRIHLSHSKQDNFIDCLFCGQSEADHNDIIRHMVDNHPNQYFACLDCYTRFPSTSELAEHKLNVCDKQKEKPYRSKLRQKVASGPKKSQKALKLPDDKHVEDYHDAHFNGVVISCELKPSQVNDEADIEDNITTNLILPPNKNLGTNTVMEKNAVIVLDDFQWNKRMPTNFSFHNTDADQILSRLGVVHRSPRTAESTKKDWFKNAEEPVQKFEKCFDTGFYTKVASNVHENLAKFLDGSFNFNPDPDAIIKTRKSKQSVIINTAEGFPILLAFEQFTRNVFDGYIPRTLAPKHKWKWENDKSPLIPDDIKHDTHVNNCIITLVSSLDIWTQLRMRRKFEEKFRIPPLEKKTEKQNIISKELKEILESRELPSSSQQVMKYVTKPVVSGESLDFPASLGLKPSAPTYDMPPAVLSGEWVRPRCYVCCACGAQTRDSRGLSSHISTQHPNAQVQHYEIVGELLLNADILKHLYVPPSQMCNRTRPLRGFRECTKCKKSISLEDLHQHMLDCAGDTPTVRRKCRYRPFGVRRRRPRLPDNTIRKKIRKDIQSRQTRQKTHMRSRPKIRSEVGDAETIRKMLADLPAKRHRVMVNPMNPILRPRRKLDKQRNKIILKRRSSEIARNRKQREIKASISNPPRSHSGENDNDNKNNKSDDENKPLKPKMKRVLTHGPRPSESLKRKVALNRAKRRAKMIEQKAMEDSAEQQPPVEASGEGTASSGNDRNQLSIDNTPQKIDVSGGPQGAREKSSRGSRSNNRSNRDDQRPGSSRSQSGNFNNSSDPMYNPLKHSIARLTSETEIHERSMQYQQLFLMQPPESTEPDVSQHGPSGKQRVFENEAVVTKLDKPPLHFNLRAPIDAEAYKNRLPKPKKGLNDCIAMLKNKLVDPIPLEKLSQTVQCDNDDQLNCETTVSNQRRAAVEYQMNMSTRPAEIYSHHPLIPERYVDYPTEAALIAQNYAELPFHFVPTQRIPYDLPPPDIRIDPRFTQPSTQNQSDVQNVPATRRRSTRSAAKKQDLGALQSFSNYPVDVVTPSKLNLIQARRSSTQIGPANAGTASARRRASVSYTRNAMKHITEYEAMLAQHRALEYHAQRISPETRLMEANLPETYTQAQISKQNQLIAEQMIAEQMMLDSYVNKKQLAICVDSNYTNQMLTAAFAESLYANSKNISISPGKKGNRASTSPGNRHEISKQASLSPGDRYDSYKRQSVSPRNRYDYTNTTTPSPGSRYDNNMRLLISPGTLNDNNKYGLDVSGGTSRHLAVSPGGKHVAVSPGTRYENTKHLTVSPGSMYDSTKHASVSPGGTRFISKQGVTDSESLYDHLNNADVGSGSRYDNTKHAGFSHESRQITTSPGNKLPSCYDNSRYVTIGPERHHDNRKNIAVSPAARFDKHGPINSESQLDRHAILRNVDQTKQVFNSPEGQCDVSNQTTVSPKSNLDGTKHTLISPGRNYNNTILEAINSQRQTLHTAVTSESYTDKIKHVTNSPGNQFENNKYAMSAVNNQDSKQTTVGLERHFDNNRYDSVNLQDKFEHKTHVNSAGSNHDKNKFGVDAQQCGDSKHSTVNYFEKTKNATQRPVCFYDDNKKDAVSGDSQQDNTKCTIEIDSSKRATTSTTPNCDNFKHVTLSSEAQLDSIRQSIITSGNNFENSKRTAVSPFGYNKRIAVNPESQVGNVKTSAIRPGNDNNEQLSVNVGNDSTKSSSVSPVNKYVIGKQRSNSPGSNYITKKQAAVAAENYNNNRHSSASNEPHFINKKQAAVSESKKQSASSSEINSAKAYAIVNMQASTDGDLLSKTQPTSYESVFISKKAQAIALENKMPNKTQIVPSTENNVVAIPALPLTENSNKTKILPCTENSRLTNPSVPLTHNSKATEIVTFTRNSDTVKSSLIHVDGKSISECQGSILSESSSSAPPIKSNKDNIIAIKKNSVETTLSAFKPTVLSEPIEDKTNYDDKNYTSPSDNDMMYQKPAVAPDSFINMTNKQNVRYSESNSITQILPDVLPERYFTPRKVSAEYYKQNQYLQRTRPLPYACVKTKKKEERIPTPPRLKAPSPTNYHPLDLSKTTSNDNLHPSKTSSKDCEILKKDSSKTLPEERKSYNTLDLSHKAEERNVGLRDKTGPSKLDICSKRPTVDEKNTDVEKNEATDLSTGSPTDLSVNRTGCASHKYEDSPRNSDFVNQKLIPVFSEIRSREEDSVPIKDTESITTDLPRRSHKMSLSLTAKHINYDLKGSLENVTDGRLLNSSAGVSTNKDQIMLNNSDALLQQQSNLLIVESDLEKERQSCFDNMKPMTMTEYPLIPNIVYGPVHRSQYELHSPTTTDASAYYDEMPCSPMNSIGTDLMNENSLNVDDNEFDNNISFHLTETIAVHASNMSTGAGSIPLYTLSNAMTPLAMSKYESTTPVYTLTNACISMAKVEPSTVAPLSDAILSIPSTTIASVAPVYTLTDTTVNPMMNYIHTHNKSVQDSNSALTKSKCLTENNETKNVNSSTSNLPVVSIEKTDNGAISYGELDPETAKKIARLPKELVEILGTMPEDHRRQLLNVLPQYVSTSATTSQNDNPDITNAEVSEFDIKPSINYSPVSSSHISRPVTSIISGIENLDETKLYQSGSNLLGEVKKYEVSEQIPQPHEMDENAVIDLTEDEVLQNAEVLKGPEEPIDVAKKINEPASIASNNKANKSKSNEQTASLRAVRIKAPSERKKSISNENTSLTKSINEQVKSHIDVIANQGNSSNLDKTLAIQQAEITSTQHNTTVGNCKYPLAISPSSTEYSGDESNKPVSQPSPVPAPETVTEKEVENNFKTPVPKSGMVSSSISTNDANPDVENNLLEINLPQSADLNNASLMLSTSKEAITDEEISLEQKISEETSTLSTVEQHEDSDDDISLAAIVKQKRGQGKINAKKNALNSKANRKKKDKKGKKLGKKEQVGTLENVGSNDRIKDLSVSDITTGSDDNNGQNMNNGISGHIDMKNPDRKEVNPNLTSKQSKKVPKRGRRVNNEPIATENFVESETDINKENDSKSEIMNNIVNVEQQISDVKTDIQAHKDSFHEDRRIVYDTEETNIKTNQRLNKELTADAIIKISKCDDELAAHSSKLAKELCKAKEKKKVEFPNIDNISEENLCPSNLDAKQDSPLSISITQSNKDIDCHNTISPNLYPKNENASQVADNKKRKKSVRSKKIKIDVITINVNEENDNSENVTIGLEKKENVITPLRRSRRGKSLFLDNMPTQQEPISYSEISVEPKAPITKKQLIFSKLLLDEGNSKPIAHSTPEKPNSSKDENKVSVPNKADEAPEISDVEHVDEVYPEKLKGTKRRINVQLTKKSKKKKSIDEQSSPVTDIKPLLEEQAESPKSPCAVLEDSSKQIENSDELVHDIKADSINTTAKTQDISNYENSYDTDIPIISTEKRKNNNQISFDLSQSSKPKKCKMNKGDIKNLKTNTSLPVVASETKTACYNLPLPARRARSKSVVVKPSTYDPYDIDLEEDMVEQNEVFFRKVNVSKNMKKNIKSRNHTTKGNKATKIDLKEKCTIDSSVDNKVVNLENNGHDRGSICDSDDSSKSDIPLKKYVEEKEKKVKDGENNLSDGKEIKAQDEKHQIVKNNETKCADPADTSQNVTQTQAEEELRSEQFMESFGFFSERKPRKSNLLATKKISETFHITNESDDMYFGFKERTGKKNMNTDVKKSIDIDKGEPQPSTSKRAAAPKRRRGKKTATKTMPSYCALCKKEFRRSDNYLRHQMSLSHISKLSEVELKIKIIPLKHEEPNHLVAYKQYVDRLKKLTDLLDQKKIKYPREAAKINMPTLQEIRADVYKKVRDQQRCGLSLDEELFIECCELLKDSNNLDERGRQEKSSLDILEQAINELGCESNDDNLSDDDDCDSITAQNILESEEVKNLEKDLICGLKEAANATRNANIEYQHSLKEFAAPQVVQMVLLEQAQQAANEDSHATQNTADVPPEQFNEQFSSPNATDNHYEPIDEFGVSSKTRPTKAKKHMEVIENFEIKEKMYPDIQIEDIDMFEDKFDKIKRKCRSQAAAAKQPQPVVDQPISHKGRKKSEKKKGKRISKKARHQSTHVPTKGALKGFDGIKVSIPTSDINMSGIVPVSESMAKKKKKSSSKKKRDKRDSESSSKYDSDNRAKDNSIAYKKVDVYEFMDNEDAELFEFRPSTLMERFKSITNNKDLPSTSKFNVAVEDNSSQGSASDGDDFVYMSDDYVGSGDDETENSLMSCELGNAKVGNDIKKNSPQKRKDVVEKNAVMGKIFKHNAVRAEKKVVPKEPEKPKANLDQLFDSLLEEEPNSSALNSEAEPKDNDFSHGKKFTQTSVKSNSLGKNYDQSSDNEAFAYRSKSRSSLPAKDDEIQSSTALSKRRSFSPSKEYISSSKKRENLSSRKYDLQEFDYGPSTSKQFVSKLDSIDYEPSTSKKYSTVNPNDVRKFSSNNSDTLPKHDTKHKKRNDSSSKNDDKLFNTYSDDVKSPSIKLDEGISTSYDYSADVYDQSALEDEAGVARQRARRKCTVGKQNILAETWSSESEPDGGPPRSNSAQSVISGIGRKKKARKKDGQQASGRRGNNRHVANKKQDVEGRLSNRALSSAPIAASCSSIADYDPGEGPSGLCNAGRSDAAISGASDAAAAAAAAAAMPAPSTSAVAGPSNAKGRQRSVPYFWSSEGDDEQEHQQQHGWIVGDSHKKLVTMLAHAKGRKRNNDDKRHLVE